MRSAAATGKRFSLVGLIAASECTTKVNPPWGDDGDNPLFDESFEELQHPLLIGQPVPLSLAVDKALVLDVGCGVGRVTSYPHDRGLDVRGIDHSAEMIATARSLTPTWCSRWGR